MTDPIDVSKIKAGDVVTVRARWLAATLFAVSLILGITWRVTGPIATAIIVIWLASGFVLAVLVMRRTTNEQRAALKRDIAAGERAKQQLSDLERADG